MVWSGDVITTHAELYVWVQLGMEQMKQLSTEEVYNNYVESRSAYTSPISHAPCL